MIAFDTETHLIGPGQVIPRLVCASFHSEGQDPHVVGNGDEFLHWTLLNALDQSHDADDGHLVGANIAYDLAVIMVAYPDLTSLIFKAYEEKRVHDVQIREKLINLGTHGSIDFGPTNKPLSYSLAALARARVGLDLSAGKEGDDIWRLRYHELDGLPASEYPKEAYDYAALDAQATYEVWEDQEKEDPRLLRAEHIHCKAAFDLILKTAYGLEVDKPLKAKLQAEVEADLSPAKLDLLYQGDNPIVIEAKPAQPYARGAKAHKVECSPKDRKTCDCPPKMKAPTSEKLNKKAALIPLIEAVCAEHGVEVKKTDKGFTSASAEFLKEIAHLDPRLKQYQARANLIKLQTSYFPGFEWPMGSGVTADVIHPGYSVLKKTGRVSSRGNSKKTKNPLYPSVNIQQADPRIRSIYKPRDGWIYAVCDYSAIDLVSCAQTMWDLFGRSNLKDQIDRSVDPHSFLGSVLAYHEDPEFKAEIEGKTDEEGYRAFLARKDDHEEGCPDPLDCECPKPKWFKHWRKFAKPVGLGFPGGLGLKTMVGVCAGYGITIDKAQAKRLRKIWYSVYPVMKRYLRGWVEAQNGVYESPLGMIRSNCSYTELANGRALQTPAAEGMKVASWKVTRACYDPALEDVLLGCRPVMVVHDELVMEIPDDEWATLRADRMSQLMVEGMNEVLPDVKVKADPVLTRRWVKEAESKRVSGKLTIYE